MTEARREQNKSIRNRCYVVGKFSSSVLVARPFKQVLIHNLKKTKTLNFFLSRHLKAISQDILSCLATHKIIFKLNETRK